MSDVVVSVTESTTAVTVTEQDVAVAVTETSVDVSSSTAGVQGATGVGYTGVTSTSTIIIGAGLKTFTLVSGYQGAFITGMRIRAIHSDTPTYYLEGTANYVGAGTLIITVDKFNGSGSHNSWAFAVAGEVGQTGATGSSGVVSVTSPITNTGTAGSAIVGIDQTALSITQSQVTSLVTDLAGKASLGAANAFTVGGHTITSEGTAVIPLILKAASGQTGNLQEWQNSAGTVQARVTSGGSLVTTQGFAVLGGASISGTTASLFQSAAAARIPVVVQGASGQSVDLFQIQNNSATVLGGFGNTGNFKVRTATEFSGALNVAAASSTQIGAVIRGAASQSANLQEWQNSAGTVLISVNPAGSLVFSGSGSLLSGTNGRGLFITNDAAIIPMTIRGAASQSANLQEWQNSAGTALAKVESTGAVVAARYALPSSVVALDALSSGGSITMTRPTGALTNPGANSGRIYFRDGTTAGTLKLVVRAGTAGAEETLFDNLDQTGTSTIAIGSGVRATDATVATASTGVGYMGLPQNTTTTGAYTIVAADAGEHIYASATRTVTIPANSALALPIGTTLTFIAGAGATMTIAITTDTMYLAGAGTTGSRTLAAHGIATAVKTTATTWIISGNGLT